MFIWFGFLALIPIHYVFKGKFTSKWLFSHYLFTLILEVSGDIPGAAAVQLCTNFPSTSTGHRFEQFFIFLHFSFERQQALVEEQLARLAQKERESAATTGLDELSPALLTEKDKAFQEQERAKMLVSDAFWSIPVDWIVAFIFDPC